MISSFILHQFIDLLEIVSHQGQDGSQDLYWLVHPQTSWWYMVKGDSLSWGSFGSKPWLWKHVIIQECLWIQDEKINAKHNNKRIDNKRIVIIRVSLKGGENIVRLRIDEEARLKTKQTESLILKVNKKKDKQHITDHSELTPAFHDGVQA